MEQVRLEPEPERQAQKGTNTKDEQLKHGLHQTSRGSEQLAVKLQRSLEQEDKDESIRSKNEASGTKEDAISSKDEDMQEEEEERETRKLCGSEESKRESSISAEPLKLKWEKRPDAPLESFGECSPICGKFVYCYYWDVNTIMRYNSETGEWNILPKCQKRKFAITVVQGLLTAIGGEQFDEPTKSLLSLTEQQEWIEQFPTMTYDHFYPAVACTSTSLIVAGGCIRKSVPVEVMDTETLHWSTAANLPYVRREAAMVISGDRLYIMGGYKGFDDANSVLTCSVSELLKSTPSQRPLFGARMVEIFSQMGLSVDGPQPSTDNSSVWQEIAPLPVYFTTPVIFHGRLLAIGGCESRVNPTSAVREYDPATNSWKVISHLSTRRHCCFTTVLPDNTLLVMGGIVALFTYTASVEVASCV